MNVPRSDGRVIVNYFTTAPDSEVLLFQPVDAKCLAMIGPNIIGTSNAVLRRCPEVASPAVNGENDRIGSQIWDAEWGYTSQR